MRKRGERIDQQTEPSPSKAEPLAIDRDADGPTLMRAVLRNALQQVLANASEVAEGSESPDVIHQARVGLRRLRTALRELAPLSPGSTPGGNRPFVNRSYTSASAETTTRSPQP